MANGSTVHGNPAEMKKFANQVRETEKQIGDLKKKVEAIMRSIDWDDPVKRTVDEALGSILKSINQSAKQLQGQANLIDRKAAILQDFLRR